MKSKDVIIREFRMDDYDNVLRLWREVELNYHPNGQDNRQFIENELKSGRAIFLAAESNNGIIGAVLGTHDGRKGWINRLAVAKDFRRQDIARKLVTPVEIRLNVLVIHVIACMIENGNTISMKFFEKTGVHKRSSCIFLEKTIPGLLAPLT